MEAQSNRAPYCPHCKHYHVTWDKNFPYACDVFEIKSKEIQPSFSVYRNTGKHCPCFELNSKLKF